MFVIDGTVVHSIPSVGTLLPQKSADVSASQDIFAPWVKLVSSPPRETPPIVRAVQRLVALTGMSNRRLATLLTTTHPTVASVLQGNEPDRLPRLAATATSLLNVMEKIFIVCGRDPRRVQAAMRFPAGGDATVADLLRDGKYGQAYLAVIDANQAPRRLGQLAQARSVRKPRRSTVSLVDDDDE